jgi:protein-S-isoprenylcysteine O-methyltransferase Ste14
VSSTGLRAVYLYPTDNSIGSQLTQYWSATVYDRATHALIRDLSWPSRSSQTPGLQTNGDGPVDVYFGPKAPPGKETNWVPTRAWEIRSPFPLLVMTIVRVTLVTVGTAAYLGLAILGWGGWTAFFSHPARVALAVALAVMAGVSLFAGGNLSPGLREDRGNRWVLDALALIGLLNAYLPAYADRKECWTLDGDPMRWLGVGLFAAGGALRIWPVFVLGRRFSGLVAIQPGHTLVTSGVYGVIRHPSYLGLLVNALGWGLAFRSGVGLLLTPLMIPPLLARMRAEERLLRTQFGAAYGAYGARTSRLIPGLY